MNSTVPMISGSISQFENSGMAEGDVSTVKLEPSFDRLETAVSWVMPSVFWTLLNMTD